MGRVEWRIIILKTRIKEKHTEKGTLGKSGMRTEI